MPQAILRTETFATWLDGLRDKRAQTIIAARIERVAAGNLGDAKALGGALHEIRINFAAGYRVYYTVRAGEVLILLAGGDKSSQQRDIAKARQMIAELSFER